MLPRPLVIAIAVLVVAFWAASVTIGFFDPTRSIPGINVFFGIIVGSAFTLDNPKLRAMAKRLPRLVSPPADEPDATDQGTKP